MFSLLVPLAWTFSSAYAGTGGFDSFEDGIPGHWQSSRDGNLEPDRAHYKHGGQSLRWDWRGGDSIRVERGLGDIERTGGYGGTYGKASFGVWLYQQEPVEAKMRFEFRRGSEATAHFDFDLNFTGWRPAYLWFERDFEGEVHPETDNIRIVAPREAREGTTFIDLVVYNGILDFRAQHVPRSQEFRPGAWLLRDRHFPKPGEVSDPERDGIERIHRFWVRQLAGTGTVTDRFLQEVDERIAGWRIVEDERGVRGQPVVFRHTAFFEGEGVEGLTTPRPIADLMLEIGRRYHRTESAEVRERLGERFVLLARHLRDQGLEAGSGFQWNWYPGRSFAEALLLMRDPLRENGLLGWAFTFMDYNYGISDIFDDGTMGNPHMDYFFFDKRYRLFGILLLDDPADQVRHLRAYSRRLSKDILLDDGPNGFKPDGSTWHHWGHYFAYAVYCVDTLATVMQGLSDTPFRVTEDAYNQVKRAVMAMRYYSNRADLPLSLHGRHPFNYGRGQSLNPRTFLTLARSNTYGAPGNLDADLAEAYLRLEPEAAGEALFRQYGIRPEPDPSGNRAMNYAGISMHRRDHWLALAKGYSKYVWAAEIYQSENRFGRYLSHGALEILASGDPVNFHDSGYREDGWDWNRLDGTTVIYLPPEKLNSPSPGSEMARSNQTFVGGLSHRNENGAFVMVIEGHPNHAPSFRGRKSYFFFNDRILAVGSNIRNDDQVHPTHTNLFQKYLPERSTPVAIDGETIGAFPFERSLGSRHAHWLMDTQGTGYYLPAGTAASVARRHQRSRDHKNERDTEGDFVTAWIDHGTAPDNADYTYIVLPDATPERMNGIVEGMARRTPILRVLQQDERAHIAYDAEYSIWGFVFFEPQRVQGASPIVEVNRPCLIMVEREAAGRWHLSFCDPDLNLIEHASQPRAAKVTLKGNWAIAGRVRSDVRVLERSGGQTVIEFIAHQGRSFNVTVVERQ